MIGQKGKQSGQLWRNELYKQFLEDILKEGLVSAANFSVRKKMGKYSL